MEFSYNNKQSAQVYLITKSKGEIVKIGPPVKMEKAALEFKKKNKNVFEKSGVLHSKIEIDVTGKDFLRKWSKDKNNKRQMRDMGIIAMKIT